MKPVISETPLPVDLYRYDEISESTATSMTVTARLTGVKVNDWSTWRYNYDLNGKPAPAEPGEQRPLAATTLRPAGPHHPPGRPGRRAAGAFSTATTGWAAESPAEPAWGQHLQFFYADLNNPVRVTHIFNHSSSDITSLYYDLQGHLFAMEVSSERSTTSPLTTRAPLRRLQQQCQMMKQLQYTAYGEVYHDSNPDFQLVVGFHGGLYDTLTKLVHFTQRDYDVLAGRWTAPDYTLWHKIGKNPAPFNLYMFKNNNPLSDMLDVKNYVTDVKSWLVMFGFQLSNIIPGFPKHTLYFVEPPYELLASQECENGQLITGVQQAAERHNRAFMALEGRLLNKERRGKADKPGVSNMASDDSRKVAVVLNGAIYVEGTHYTQDGRDCHFFVKRALRLAPDVLDEERTRLLELARQRALSGAWARRAAAGPRREGRQPPLDRPASGSSSSRRGACRGTMGYYVIPVEEYPQLADSSTNIQFLRQNEMGKR
ncbi:hypothetical protein SKAU_G00426220 [Synaphobranchus kaupii]|uniref:Teneurin-like YD-shell domain-containing protein n=1 Tax=Synaphobranchus kaupii TaxID=118154 RepID=A0A9Q1E574_SYNKA|nr:hypothetical protein SKAU_G00426220 [Synaphobranchus kaupii]